MQNGKPGLETPSLQTIVRDLLIAIGENPGREGLRKTPFRVQESLEFLTRGYQQDIDGVLNGAVFPSDCDEMVVVRDIDFFSLCEHHLLPFFGKAHVAYLPKGRIIGLSKIPRIVDMFARRLQVQENLTMEVARGIQQKLRPAGVGVIAQGYHLCMMMRGVEKQNALCVTSAMLGKFKTDPRTRQEFLNLAIPKL